MTPVSGNDEKHSGDGERRAGDNRPHSRHLEGWDLSGDKPDAGKQDQQEANLGERDARLVAQGYHRDHGSCTHRSAWRVANQNLRGCPWPRGSPRLRSSEVPAGGHESPHFWPRELSNLTELST
jgi:hypothetical protein